MPKRIARASAVKDFILRNVREHPADIVALTMQRFGCSRPAALRHINKAEAEGFLVSRGRTFARRYELKPLVEQSFVLPIDFLWGEDTVWRERLLPLFQNVKKNILEICQYGFTEMLNNVLDHARSPEVYISFRYDYAEICMVVADKGIGIFKKIQQDFNLDDPRTALLELSKGKLTSDRRRHSGEGIYFTSRAFDKFNIRSGNLFYSREKKDGDDWLIEVNDRPDERKGTTIKMWIGTDAEWTMRSVFDKYQGESLRFRKTHVPIMLAQYPGEQLISRSQAKRVLARFENFSEVFLDFSGVEQIGQAFADEIFRVFRLDHPEIEMSVSNTNEAVEKMIEFVSGTKIVC